MREEKGYFSGNRQDGSNPATPDSLLSRSLADNNTGWQDYYIYAQHLYNSGNRERAEYYYTKAQKLYYTEEERNSIEYKNAGRTLVDLTPRKYFTTSPSSKDSSSSVDPSQSDPFNLEKAPENVPIVEPVIKSPANERTDKVESLEQRWSQLAEQGVLDRQESITKPKRRLGKAVLKILSVLMFFLMGVVGGLFYLYQTQKSEPPRSLLQQSETKASLLSSLLDTDQNQIAQQMVNSLTPAFQKIDRLAHSTKPLLREMGIMSAEAEDPGRPESEQRVVVEPHPVTLPISEKTPQRLASPVDSAENDLADEDQCSEDIPIKQVILPPKTGNKNSAKKVAKTNPKRRVAAQKKIKAQKKRDPAKYKQRRKMKSATKRR